jgi:soluble lytic murein transglycosylase-like protein
MAPPAGPAAGPGPGELVGPLASAAGALRQRDCAAAGAEVARRRAAAGTAETARLLDLVAGLYAHACEDVGRAEERLLAAAPTSPAAPLEDWRLLVLADSAAAAGHPGLARQTLEDLLALQPASPLRPQALREAVDLAHAAGDAAAVLDAAERARREGLVGEERRRVETTAWESAATEAAARGLLVHDPGGDLAVAALARLAPGASPAQVHWGALLSAPELVRRAERLLELDQPVPALVALEAVPAEARDLPWRLLVARGLVADRRGLEALWRLKDLEVDDPAAEARLDWQRALAARDAARVRRGSGSPTSDERERLREASRAYLDRVSRQRADLALASRALSDLFAEHWDGGRFDEALDALRRMRVLDPSDTTGARKLWEAGWHQYGRRNASGAVGYWAELTSLYPDSSYARAGRYWTARAFEGLGEGDRARDLYRDLATAEAVDFYSRNAIARLGGGVAAAGEPLAEDRGIPWPQHEDLARARLLTDLGLDGLAAAELAAVSARSEAGDARGDASWRRAAAALDSLILARRGELRPSISRIREAFPALGGPFQAAVPALALRLYYPLAYADVIREQAARRGLPPSLVMGMVRQESGFDADATSRAGARGLMQLMPATARETARKIGLPFAAERLRDPSFNVALGTAYFDQVLGMFDGNLELALAGYNGGPYRIKRLWRQAPPETGLDAFLEGLPVEESRIYMKRILLLTDSYRQLHPEAREPV